MVAEIYRRTLDGVAFFVDNETKAPVLVKEHHPMRPASLLTGRSQRTVIFPSRIRT
jgi:hypothetical protein